MEKNGAVLSKGVSSLHTLPHEQKYLVGLRGFLALQSFTWVFLQTFVPVAVKSSANTKGNGVEKILRKTLSVLFWNDSLIYSSIILLSARMICVRFLLSSNKTALASSVFRRGLRLWIPTAVSLAFVKILTSTIGTEYIDDFKTQTGNVSFQTPYSIPNALAYFNSVFNLFWVTRNFHDQAGSLAFPSQTLWIVNIIYTQSYTIFMTMVIVPYTRNSWRVQAYVGFILTAWWVQSWAWYSVTGLLLADLLMNMRYQERAQRGVALWKTSVRYPAWVPCAILMAAGLTMQYLWIAWRPQYENKELGIHTALYESSAFNTEIDPNEPQARDDNYLLILGFFLILEYSTFLQKVFRNQLFLYLGARSFSWFLLQSITIYSAGIKLFMRLSLENNVSVEGSRVICLVVCLVAAAAAAEIFYWLVDLPSQLLAHVVFDWIRK
ncbi:hypothetical protein ACLMJK_006368 [Lecanora helva]